MTSERETRTSGALAADEQQDALLRVRDLRVAYGDVQVLKGLNLHVGRGESVAVIGANGAGKTTLLRTICGLMSPVSGSIELGGVRIDRKPPHVVAASGLRLVPEGRQMFGRLSVRENLILGGYTLYKARKGSEAEATMERMFERFPILKARSDAAAGHLSGGEQQMLALARALMSSPEVLLLDEPSTGLAPLIVEEVFVALSQLQQEGLTIVLVEQIATKALAFADRGYVLEVGEVVLEGSAAELAGNPHVEAAYLGGSGKKSGGAG